MAGIFFKYDINPLKIIIREEEYTLLQLILRIFGCVGGVYILSGTSKARAAISAIVESYKIELHLAGLLTNLCHAYICYKYGQDTYFEAKVPTKENQQKSSNSI